MFIGFDTAQPAVESPTAQVPICTQDSQIGLALVNGKHTLPVYNMVSPRGAPAMFRFYYNGIVVTLPAKLRPTDYGIDIITRKAPSSVPISKFEVQLWGVPADDSRSLVRAECTEGLYGANGSTCPSIAPRVPFLRTPTSCPGTTLPWSIDISSYQHPDTFIHGATTTPAMTNCESNPFAPGFSLVPSTLAPNAPTGVDAEVTLDQDYGPDGLAPADLRRASVTLPDGLTINPSSADGLAACTDDQLGFGREGPAQCPDASKLGTVQIDTPLLDVPVRGALYLATPFDNPSRSLIGIYLVAQGAGVTLKLPGQVAMDPDTGQITTTIDDNCRSCRSPDCTSSSSPATTPRL